MGKLFFGFAEREAIEIEIGSEIEKEIENVWSLRRFPCELVNHVECENENENGTYRVFQLMEALELTCLTVLPRRDFPIPNLCYEAA